MRAGDYAHEGKALAAVVSRDNWHIMAAVNERHLSRLKAGQTVCFTIGSDPWRVHVGTVRSIAPGIARTQEGQGALPYVPLDTDWIRLPRRFPVLIDMGDLCRNSSPFTAAPMRACWSGSEPRMRALLARPLPARPLPAASVVLSILVGAFLGLDDLWWAAISAWAVSNPDFAVLWRKLAMRLAGTAAGLVIGYSFAILMEGVVAFQALALFAVSAIGSYMRFASRYGYAWFYGSFTLMLMITVSIMEPQSLFAFAQFRFAEIVCGVSVSAFVHALARPAFQRACPAHAPATAAEPDLDLTRLALVGGITAVGMTAIWSWFLIPSMPQAVGSTLAVLDRDFASVKVRARQRFLGCALGAGLGLAALLLELDALPVYATVLFAGIFYFTRLHNGGGPQNYIGTQGGIAFITAMVTGAGPPSDLMPVIERLAAIFIGVTLMVGVSFVLAALDRRAWPAPA